MSQILSNDISLQRKPSYSDAARWCSSSSLPGVRLSFAANSEVYAEERAATSLCKVIQGAVRTYKSLSDGRRQIEAFYLRGDFFGIEAASEHYFSADAICDSEILIIDRRTLNDLAVHDQDIAQMLLEITALQLSRTQKHLMLLGRKNAQERLAAFLIEMAIRDPRSDIEEVIELPMSRNDIADYLSLTPETVSRTIAYYEHTHLIKLPSSRRIVLLNRDKLESLAYDRE